MSHPNETMLRHAYDAFSRGDIGTLTAMLSEDIIWHVSGESPAAGDCSGTDGVLQFFASMMALYDWTLEVTVDDLLAGDDHGVVLTHESGTSARSAARVQVRPRLDDPRCKVQRLRELPGRRLPQVLGDPSRQLR